MKKLLVATLALAALCEAAAASEETLSFGRFGQVTLYRPSPQPSNVALFVSGDGGWNQGVVDMARELSAMDTLVVGVDIVRYLKALEGAEEKCAYPASDFEALSQFVQKKLDLPVYQTPVLVGYSSGATLVYALLVQAPPGTFRGALGLGFCPDLLVNKPFCKGSGLEFKPGGKGKGVIFQPAPRLESPFIALQGTVDQVCDPPSTESYMKQVGHGEVVMLPKVGHGYSVPRNWLPQFKESFAKIAGPKASQPAKEPPTPKPAAANEPPAGPPGSAAPQLQPEPPKEVPVGDLPLIEVSAKAPEADCLAVILSGDGGWTSIDKEIGGALASRGYPVVGLNSLQYFWKARTPDSAAKDLERILAHYMAAWKKEKVLLIGYSYGADVLPFMANRLPADLLSKVQLTVLLGLSATVAFEFHVSEWLGGSSSKELPVLPEVRKLKGARIVCFYGEDEKDSLCRGLDAGLAKLISLPGAHHFGGNYNAVADAILGELAPKEK